MDIKGVNQKTGDLHVELNGMDVDMQQFPARIANGLPKGKRPDHNALTSIVSFNLPFLTLQELCTIRFLIIH